MARTGHSGQRFRHALKGVPYEDPRDLVIVELVIW